MVEALVEFDYTAQAPDELTLKKGDLITAIKTEPGNGWWEGSLKGHRGLFPDNFVKVLKKEAPSDSGKDEKNGVVLRSGSKRRCKAVFSYKPVNDDELELKVNDIIEVLTEVEEGWWRGKLRNKVGVFPSNFVREEPLAEGGVVGDVAEKVIPKTKSDSKRSTKEYCRVLFPYEAANGDELTLTKGDTVLILSKVVQDKGWWKGELKGKIGVFPDNFVELIPADVGPKKADRLTSNVSTTDTGVKAVIKTDPAHPPEATTSHTEPLESPSKGEEKPQVPPIPGKKPQLPPPLKKPQRLPPGHPPSVQMSSASAASGLSAIKRISGEFEAWGAAGDAPDGAKMSCMSKSNSHANPISAVRLRRIDSSSSSASTISDNVGNLPPSGEMDFDSVERSAMLSHPTASRAKAPRRRPPSAMFPGKENEGGLMNGSAESEETVGIVVEAPRTFVENGGVSEDATKDADGTVATANGGSEDIREKKSPAGAASRAPFMEELKMSQAKRGNPVSSNVRSVTVQPSTVQVVPSSTTPPRPLSHSSPPNPYPAHGVHVHQGAAASDVSQLKQQRPFSSRMEEGSARSTTVITGVSHVAISPAVADTTPAAMLPSAVAADSSTTLISSSSRMPSGDGPAPTALSRRPVSAYAADIPSHRRVAAQFSSWQEPISDGDSVPVTPQMYKELRERVEQLEQTVGNLSETFTQTMNQLKEELGKERERRKVLQDIVNQLQSLLTHV
ncbi:SH3 domain-containing kinase-binding protein 1 isoform X2 [Hetaerina americana]|uniref:SH3 domain-containing kinase-binding protein 1 isoform X2 n=1 Tax=Hetaerina americana TaxID=62018 RepID=UPI003A7F2E80